MRDLERIDKILNLIKDIWTKCPNLRLSQLIMNSLGINYDPYYIEDDVLYAALKRFSKQIQGGE
jgi:uncharacterized protein YihD (DUF1040 family)